MRVTQLQIGDYLRHGYVIVPGFLSKAEIAAALENLLQYVPTPQELARTPQRYGWIYDEAEHLQTEFPFIGEALNHNSTHPEIMALVEQLLGTRDVLLSQAAMWAKYAGTGNFDQGLHLDYQGNTLVVPRDDGDYRQINMILYYSDVTEDLGPTYVVSQERTRELPLWPTHRPRKGNAELYKHERPVLAKVGDLLIFGMRTWHRASDLTADDGARFTHHLVYRAASHAFQGYHQWSQFGEKPELAAFIERATPRQRDVIGFPRIGHPYWNEESLSAVAKRYPRMDMQPYGLKREP
jgi:hypothetical protein